MVDGEGRKRVLAMDPIPEDARNRIRSAITDARNRPLKAWERRALLAACAAQALMLMGAVGIYIPSNAFGEAPIYVSVGFWTAVALLCASLAICIREMRLRRESAVGNTILVYAAFGFVVLFVAFKLVWGATVSAVDTVPLIVLGVCAIWVKVDEIRATLTERLLVNELWLVELAEQRSNGEGPDEE